MLINEPMMNRTDPLLALIANVSGRSARSLELKPGVYEVGHFGGSHFLPGYEHYPGDLSVDCYGVCDSPEQLLEKCPELGCEERRFIVTLTKVIKTDEPPEGGWRWHKWGPYIGDHDPQCEYLHDEPDIESVYVYHIYEKV